MTDPFVALVIKIAFAFLDRWLDKRIEAQGWDAGSKSRAHLLENELLRFLEPLVGELARVLAPKLVGQAFARAFPNDPSTGTWAG